MIRGVEKYIRSHQITFFLLQTHDFNSDAFCFVLFWTVISLPYLFPPGVISIVLGQSHDWTSMNSGICFFYFHHCLNNHQFSWYIPLIHLNFVTGKVNQTCIKVWLYKIRFQNSGESNLKRNFPLSGSLNSLATYIAQSTKAKIESWRCTRSPTKIHFSVNIVVTLPVRCVVWIWGNSGCCNAQHQCDECFEFEVIQAVVMLNTKASLAHTYVCVCVCVWGGGGGYLLGFAPCLWHKWGYFYQHRSRKIRKWKRNYIPCFV